MRKILVLGSGHLGKLVSQQLVQRKQFHVKNISMRKFCMKNINFCPDIVVDCLDPASFEHSDIDTILEKVFCFRNVIMNCKTISLYCYISSAMLYQQSDSVINEDTAIEASCIKASSRYIRHKYATEQLIFKSFPESCCIFRPVSLWSDDLDMVSKGFFSDLIRARATNSNLHSHPFDSQIITYLSFYDAANIICNFLAAFPYRQYDIVNVTSGCWSSRQQLKTEVNFRTLLPTPFGRRVMSKFSHASNFNFLELP